MPLIEFPCEDLACWVKGALGVERTSTGLAPVRLPDWAWREVPDLWTRDVFRMSCGVRLAFATRATTLELDIAATCTTAVDGADGWPPLVVELFVNDAKYAEREVERMGERMLRSARTVASESEPETVTLRFEGLADVDKNLEVWLPVRASVELRALRADALLRASGDGRPHWIHYGSSISHCAEALRPSQTWPAVAARLAGVEFINLGVGGSCFLDPFVARAIRDTPAACISLKVGSNMVGTALRRTFVPWVHGFLDTIRDGHPTTPLLVVSPIICPQWEDQPAGFVAIGAEASQEDTERLLRENALSLRAMREILEDVVETRSADDVHLHYLDGLRLFGEGDLAELPDGVHPSPAGYVQIGERFAELAFSAEGCFADALGAIASRSRRRHRR